MGAHWGRGTLVGDAWGKGDAKRGAWGKGDAKGGVLGKGDVWGMGDASCKGTKRRTSRLPGGCAL